MEIKRLGSGGWFWRRVSPPLPASMRAAGYWVITFVRANKNFSSEFPDSHETIVQTAHIVSCNVTLYTFEFVKYIEEVKSRRYLENTFHCIETYYSDLGFDILNTYRNLILNLYTLEFFNSQFHFLCQKALTDVFLKV
jgi:hypothetical protein